MFRNFLPLLRARPSFIDGVLRFGYWCVVKPLERLSRVLKLLLL